MEDKLAYFEVEADVAALKNIADASQRRAALDGILSFLGANPIKKVDRAFAARYGNGIEAYLGLE